MKRAAVAFAAALATAAAQAQTQASTDPLEGFNRAMFTFNDRIDAAFLKPVAQGYTAVVPELVRTGVGNFFSNLGDVWSAVNHLLQGKGEAAATHVFRVGANTLFGIGGLFDVASDLGMERQTEDFGQTLGRWGLPAGPYLVLPLLGPSSLRDASALPVDIAASPLAQITDEGDARTGLGLLQAVNTRANLLSASRVLEDVALDKYIFLRDAYLARRRSLVHDGDPPPLPEDTDAPQPK